MVHSVSGWTRGVQVKLWDPLRTRAIPERLRGVFTTRRCTNPRLPYLTLQTDDSLPRLIIRQLTVNYFTSSSLSTVSSTSHSVQFILCPPQHHWNCLNVGNESRYVDPWMTHPKSDPFDPLIHDPSTLCLLSLEDILFCCFGSYCLEHFAIDPACIDHYARTVSEWSKDNTVSFGLRDMIRYFRDCLGR